MKLLADENLDVPIVVRLRAAGHEIASIREESPGIRDEAVLSRAWKEQVVLLTADKDFGELVYRHRLPHAGVLLLRLSGMDETAKCDAVEQAIEGHGKDLAGAFSVLTGDTLRIRREPNA